MPQEFQVLQCYDCEYFQVHIIKKVAKWSCKMCGERQSVKKVFARGSGKDCRLQVQELNEMRIKKTENVQYKKCVYDFSMLETRESDGKSATDIKSEIKNGSKWAEFLEDNVKTEGFLENLPKKEYLSGTSLLECIENNVDTGVKNLSETEIGLNAKEYTEKIGQSSKLTVNMFEPYCNDLDSFLEYE